MNLHHRTGMKMDAVLRKRCTLVQSYDIYPLESGIIGDKRPERTPDKEWENLRDRSGLLAG